MQAQAAGTRLPRGSGAVTAQTGELMPGLAGVGRAEQGRVLDPGVERVRIRNNFV